VPLGTSANSTSISAPNSPKMASTKRFTMEMSLLPNRRIAHWQ